MKEGKRIGVTSKTQMPMAGESKGEKRLQMSNAKEPCIRGNKIWKLCQRMKECKWSEMMNNSEMHSPPAHPTYCPPMLTDCLLWFGFGIGLKRELCRAGLHCTSGLEERCRR
jgi:hypothetical protein